MPANPAFEPAYAALEDAGANVVYPRSYEIRKPIEIRALPEESAGETRSRMIMRVEEPDKRARPV